MVCKYFEIVVKSHGQLGGPNITSRSPECKLKKSNPQMQLAIYSALFDKGLEGSFVTNDCPVASQNLWTECPYFEEKK